MAYFARLGVDNVVVRVDSVDNRNAMTHNGIEKEELALEYLRKVHGNAGTWVKCSYNTVEGIHQLGGTPLRANFPGGTDPDDPWYRKLIIRTIESLAGQPALFKLYREYQENPNNWDSFWHGCLDQLKLKLDFNLDLYKFKLVGIIKSDESSFVSMINQDGEVITVGMFEELNDGVKLVDMTTEEAIFQTEEKYLIMNFKNQIKETSEH
mgnify:CR=1 FL=1